MLVRWVWRAGARPMQETVAFGGGVGERGVGVGDYIMAAMAEPIDGSS